jgi:hypothetical protein
VSCGNINSMQLLTASSTQRPVHSEHPAVPPRCHRTQLPLELFATTSTGTVSSQQHCAVCGVLLHECLYKAHVRTVHAATTVQRCPLRTSCSFADKEVSVTIMPM